MNSNNILIGKPAINWIAAQIGEIDNAASSHWVHEHKTFRYENGKLYGLRGFGHHAAPARGLRRFFHILLQKRYRRMGTHFTSFQRLDQIAAHITRRQNRLYELDVLRQSLSLASIAETIPQCLFGAPTVLIIGDGFGSMTSLVLAAWPTAQVINVNLTKTLLVDLLYASSILDKDSFAVTNNGAGVQDFLGSPAIRLLGLRATDALLLRGAPISLAINIASMQEMKIETINQYFDTMRSFDKDTIFYCCNREKKVLPSGEVISFENYPWNNGDHVVFDELCPWHQYYYSSVPPFYHPYEGVVRHKLAYLSKQ